MAVASDAERLDEGADAIQERRISAIQIAHNILWQEHSRALAPAGQPGGSPALLCRAPHASGLLEGAYDAQRRLSRTPTSGYGTGCGNSRCWTS